MFLKKNYVYFVSFSLKEDGIIKYGRIDLTISKKIKSIETIQLIENEIAKKLNNDKISAIIILNYIFLRWSFNYEKTSTSI